jgi:hypothetical protein
VHADAFEVVSLSLQVLAQRLDATLELFQGLIHVAALLPKVPLEGAQTLLEEALGLLNDPDLLIEFAVDAFQGR